MGRRPATIRDANAAKACADTVARRSAAVRSVSRFRGSLLLFCSPILRAQATLGTTTGDTNAFTINSNNSPGLAYNAVLNSDSSVSLLQDGAILSGQGCPAFSSLSSGISSGAVYVDSANSNIYLAMISGGTLYAAYESIDQTTGVCTQGPLLKLTTNALSNLEMNVDPVQGNVYILNSFGAFPDTLYILPTAPWSASSLPTPATAQPGLLRPVRTDCHRPVESPGLCQRSGRLHCRDGRNVFHLGLFCLRPESERDACRQSAARGGLQQRRNDNRAQCGNAPGQRRGQAGADQRESQCVVVYRPQRAHHRSRHHAVQLLHRHDEAVRV